MKSNRRQFIKLSALAGSLIAFNRSEAKTIIEAATEKKLKPIVISTWKFGINANAEAWKTLSANGRALDAVEKGVMVPDGNRI